jgi:glycosyltransferase involved in cell wall biosynthesis
MVITYFNYVWDIAGVSAGAATKARELLRAIENLGHTTYLEWRTPQPNGQVTVMEKLKEGLKPKLQKYLHEPKKLALNLSYLAQEYRIIKQQNPDILFARLELYNFSSAILSRWLGIPLVVEADCPVTYEHKNFYGKDFKHLGNLSAKIELEVLRKADAVIAISKILKNYYTELGVDADKIHVISNGADPEKFQPCEKPADLVKKYALQEKVVIGWIGSLAGWSGIENLIAMALYVLERHPNAAFMMVGGGANKEFFQNKLHIKNYDQRVILTGTVPHEEVPRYLACMDIVLAPYPKLPFWYASSLKIFEYMAAGKAVIAGDVGQVGEVIQDGNNGLLFDPDNEGELLQKTIAALENAELRQRLGAQARQDVLDKYSWRQHAKKIVEVFMEILTQRQRESI